MFIQICRKLVVIALVALGGTCAIWTAPVFAQKCTPVAAGSPCGNGVGNPLNVLTGNKFQREVDMSSLPGVLGLELVRSYNSFSSQPNDTKTVMGRGWRLSYDAKVEQTDRRGAALMLIDTDGTQVNFTIAKNQPPGLARNESAFVSDELGRGQLIQRKSSGFGVEYTLVRLDNTRWLFDKRGWLSQIQAPSGEFVTIERDDRGRLLKVTDPQGRSLSVYYLDAEVGAVGRQFNGIQSIDTPVGRFSYEYGSAAPKNLATDFDTRQLLANLVKVTLPSQNRGINGTQRLYHYEDGRWPTMLTGMSVIDIGSDKKQKRDRLATWAYDSEGRANLSVKGEPARLQMQAGPNGESTSIPIEPRRLVEGTGIEQVTLEFGDPLPGGKSTTVLTNSLGQTTRYSHMLINGRAQLLEVVGPGCVTCGPTNERYEYDSLGRLSQRLQLDPSGNVLVGEITEYDEASRPLRVSSVRFSEGKALPRQLKMRFEYLDKQSREPSLIAKPSVILGLEHRISVEYNDKAQIKLITETGHSPVGPDGLFVASGSTSVRVTRFDYSTINNRSVLVQVDGPLRNGPTASPSDSDITRYDWDVRADRILRITYPMGLRALFKYDEIGENPNYRLIGTTGIDGVKTQIEYAASGLVSKLTHGVKSTLMSHDAAGRLAAIIDPTGQRLQLNYNAGGQLNLLSDQQNNRINLDFDTEGRLNQAMLFDPEGSISQRSDNFKAQRQQALLNAQADGKDPIVEQMRSLIGSVNAISQSSTNVARPELRVNPFDAIGQVGATNLAQRVMRDSLGRLTTYFQNDFGQIVQIASPTTGTTRYGFDLAGNLQSRVQDDNSRALYTRDMAGRVIGVRSSDKNGKADEDASIVWGAANKPVSVSYVAGKEEFEYDTDSRLVTHKQFVDKKQFVLRYEFNALGQMDAKVLPSGERVVFKYRGLDHPRAGLLESMWLKPSIALVAPALERAVITNINSANDRYSKRSFEFGNGLTNELLLDDQGRPIQAGNAQVGQTLLKHEGTTSAKQKQTTLVGQRAKAEAASALLNQLRGHSLQLWPRSKDSGASDVTAQYLAGMLSVQTDLQFDQLGRQKSQGPASFVYDSLNRLERIEVESQKLGVSKTVAKYRYNLFGQRIAKVVPKTNGKGTDTTYFFYDGSQLVAEASDKDDSGNASGAITKQYLYVNEKPVGLLKNGELYAVHTDHRNAPLALTDESRQVVWQAQVADFLYAEPLQKPSLGKLSFNLRGSNQYFDDESGLHYNTHRYYDPKAKRYLTPDPMGLEVGPDLYAFALNQPHLINDPLGLQPVALSTIKTDADVANADFGEKLKKVIDYGASGILTTAIVEELAKLVSAEKLAVTAGIFAIWASSHAFGVGLVVDAIMLGIGYYFLGKAAADLIVGLITLTLNINGATCLKDLENAARTLSQTIAKAGSALVDGLVLRKVFSKTEGDLGATAVAKIRAAALNAKKRIQSSSSGEKLGFRASTWGNISQNGERGFIGELDAFSWIISGRLKLQAICCKTLEPNKITTQAEYDAALASYKGTNGIDGAFESAPGFFRRLLGAKTQEYVIESKAKAGTYSYTQSELNGLLGKTVGGAQQLSQDWLLGNIGKSSKLRLKDSIQDDVTRARFESSIKDGTVKRVLATTDQNGTRFWEVIPDPKDNRLVSVGKDITHLFK
jgi:RHS repeat-associated protein